MRRIARLLALLLAPVSCGSADFADSPHYRLHAPACDGDTLCALEEYIVAEYEALAARPDRGGIGATGARREDDTVVLEFVFSNRSAARLAQRSRAVNNVDLRVSLANVVCQRPFASEFFELGGRIRYVGYLPSGEQAVDTTLTRCSV